MKHITTNKGDLGVAKIVADLLSKDIQVFNPISASSAFDLVIYINDTFKKVQVKYREITNNTLTVQLRRQVGIKKYSKNEDTDILAIYCPTNDTCYYINKPDYTTTLRLIESKNNQTINIKMAKDYTKL